MKALVWIVASIFVLCLVLPASAGKGYMGGSGDVVVEEEPPPDTGGDGGMPTDNEGPLNDNMSTAGSLYGDLYKILRYQGGEDKMVQSVDAYEEAKIRLLNATHSCIAWAGTLVGYLYIHEGTHDPVIRQMAFDYVTDDTIPCLLPSPIDLAQYRDVVLDRFGNPAIADTNQRVAMDGYSKIPGFIAPTIRE